MSLVVDQFSVVLEGKKDFAFCDPLFRNKFEAHLRLDLKLAAKLFAG